jgi:hypothetical protein
MSDAPPRDSPDDHAPAAPFEPDDVLSGALRLDLAISREAFLPREVETMQLILRHLLVANEILREKDDQHDPAALTPLHSCLYELARFGQ